MISGAGVSERQLSSMKLTRQKDKKKRKKREKKDHVEEELISTVIFQTQRKRSARIVPKINLVCNGGGGENPIFRMYALGKGIRRFKTQGRL